VVGAPFLPSAFPIGHTSIRMDPHRKRRIRLIVASACAALLALALVYTSFSASTEARTPSQLLADASSGRAYQLTGKVVPGYERRADGTLAFQVRDRTGGGVVPVTYKGAVPDPFRAEREVIVTVRKEGSAFVGERDSLITKCPSKFSEAKAEQT
jgi:cytochrome c-type biogenesis protein CcmE